MPCDLAEIFNVADGSHLEFFCSGDSENFGASAVYHPETSSDIEIWEPSEIILPAIKKKKLSSAELSYAITATVEIFSSDKTTVEVVARIRKPGAEPKDYLVCKVSGTNGTIEYPRLLILMASR